MAKADHIYVDYHLYEHHGIDCADGTVIHHSSKFGKIKRTTKDNFAKGRTIYRKNYTKKYTPDEIVKRATRRLNEEEYNFIFNNCQHFAYDCTTGEPDSPQITNVGAAIAAGGAVAAAVPVTTTVSAGGILGFFGATTTAVALGPTVLVGGAIAGLGYLALNMIDKLDDD